MAPINFDGAKSFLLLVAAGVTFGVMVLDYIALKISIWSYLKGGNTLMDQALRELDFNGDSPGLIDVENLPALMLFSSLFAAYACVIRAFSTEPYLMYGLLIVFHTVAIIVDNRLWAHAVAATVALSVRLAYMFLKMYARLQRWNTAIDVEAASSVGPGERIMVLYANVGSGHKMAARAVAAALKEKGVPDENVMVLDAMDLCPRAFRYVMQSMFQKLTQSLAGEHMLGFLYDAADKGASKAEFQRFIEDFALLTMAEKIAEYRPDVIVSTHFLPAQLACTLRRKAPKATKNLSLLTVITDLDVQSMWAMEDTDVYFVPRPDAKLVLSTYLNLATEPKANERIVVSGIPIMPGFKHAAERPRAEAMAAMAKGMTDFDLDDSDPRPVVLLMSSGKLLIETYKEIAKIETPIRIVVVMGRQADVRDKFEAIPVPPRHARTLLGFVTDMPNLTRCADVLVGKSGGLTIAEAAALGVPMIVLDPIPGQETRNADVLLEAGAANKINDLPLLSRRLEDMLRDGGVKRRTMAKNITALGRPDSALTVAGKVMELAAMKSTRRVMRENEPESKKEK